MSSRVVPLLDPVAVGGDDLAMPNQHGPDRHLASVCRVSRLDERLLDQ
jgi:hypothetical protein